jgi:Cu(I)/Ag(I) efflux system membrane fusion protein
VDFSVRTMKRVTIFLVLLLAAASLAGGSRYGHRETVGASDFDGRRVLYYVDPMHPGYRSDKPGTAPDCGMSLEPVYEGTPQASSRASAADRNGAVRVSSEKQQQVGVRVQTVEKASGVERLRLYGRVAPDETRLYRINVGIEGYIREISTVTTGSQVAKNEWLATFSAPDARTTIQSYLVALDAVENGVIRPATAPGPGDAVASANLELATDRLLTLGMSRPQIDEIKRTRMIPATIKIAAPAAGFVIARNLTAGEKIASGDELFRIADLRHVWILADVFGPEAEYVRPGMIAEISVPGRATRSRAMVSRAVVPQFDAQSQSARVRLEADNPGAFLRPDMLVDVTLQIALPSAISVPVDAVLDAGLKKRVFAERADGAFEPREVETGWRFGDRIEIVRGLTAGDRVVVSGTFLLDSESRMRRTAFGAMPPP